MKSAFDITLTHFIIEEGRALASSGDTRLGKLDSLELLQILMIFQDISPIQPFAGEPVITIRTRVGSYVVRTDLHRLILSDVRRPQDPSQVLEAASIILEVDENARRQYDNLKERLNKSAAEKKQASRPQHLLSLLLWGLAALTTALALFTQRTTPHPPRADSLVEDPHEKLALFHGCMGVYADGHAPGNHAIRIQPDGKVQFMEITGTPPPRVLWDNCEIGRLGSRVCIITHQPGGLITVINRDTLSYEGNLYRTSP